MTDPKTDPPLPAVPADWTRRDPDLASFNGDPEFEGLYPATKAGG